LRAISFTAFFSETGSANLLDRPSSPAFTAAEISSRVASNSALTKSSKLAPVFSLDLGQEGLEVFLDQLVQRRFFHAPSFVVELVSNRRGLNRLAHVLFVLLF
jgi:hypothetical protein